MQGGLPTPQEAVSYWNDLGEPDYPVASSIDGDVREATGYTSGPLPGRVVVTPEMEILAIEAGHGSDEWAFDIILQHLSSQD